MNAAQVAAFAARVQATMEEVYPCSLTIGGQAYAGARGAWRNVQYFDDRLQMNVDAKVVTVRVRKALLQADGVEPRSGAMTLLVDDVLCTVTSVKAGESDPAWVLMCEASGVDEAQE